MPLTPEDVSNKRFTPVRLREGYDMGEVDQFLDEVEAELARLTRENDDLRAKLSAAQSGAVDSAPAPMPEPPAPEPVAATPEPEPEPVPTQQTPAVGAVPAGVETIRVETVGDASNAAARLLELASRNADQLVEDAKSDADKIIGEARTKAERLESESKTNADKLEADARGRAQSLDHQFQPDVRRVVRLRNCRWAQNSERQKQAADTKQSMHWKQGTRGVVVH